MTEKFPAINSTLDPVYLGYLIQQNYGLSAKTECHIFRLAMNHLYIIHDEEKKFVFRVYNHHWRTKSEIEEELKLLLHLKDANRQVAFPIADKFGDYIQKIEAPKEKGSGFYFLMRKA